MHVDLKSFFDNQQQFRQPLQNCFGCSRFAAQQVCCRLICLQERRIYVRWCLQLAVHNLSVNITAF